MQLWGLKDSSLCFQNKRLLTGNAKSSVPNKSYKNPHLRTSELHQVNPLSSRPLNHHYVQQKAALLVTPRTDASWPPPNGCLGRTQAIPKGASTVTTLELKVMIPDMLVGFIANFYHTEHSPHFLSFLYRDTDLSPRTNTVNTEKKCIKFAAVLKNSSFLLLIIHITVSPATSVVLYSSESHSTTPELNHHSIWPCVLSFLLDLS